MSEEQLKSFLKKVQGDTSLQEKLKAAADVDAALAIAKEAGFAITAEDIQDSTTVKLSDEELEGAAGGGHNESTAKYACSRRQTGCIICGGKYYW